MPSAGRYLRTKSFVSKTAAPKPRRPVPSKPEAVKEPGLIATESEPDPAVQEPKLLSDRKYGIVYRRKRRKIPAVETRMKITEAARNLAEQLAGISVGDICTGFEVPVVLTMLLEPSRSDGCVRFSTVFISILSWMRRSGSGVEGLARILFSGSLAAVFSLHCIHFLPIRRQGRPLWLAKSPQEPSSRKRPSRRGGRRKLDLDAQDQVDTKDGVKEASHVRPLGETETIHKLSPRKTRSYRPSRQGERSKLHVYMQGQVDNKERVEEASHVTPLRNAVMIQNLSPRKTISSNRHRGRGIGVYIHGLVDNKEGVEEASQVPSSWKTEMIHELSPRKTRSSRRGERGKFQLHPQGLVDNKGGLEEASQVEPSWKSEPMQKLSPREARLSNRQERQGGRGRGRLNVCMQGPVNNKNGVED